MTVQPTIQNQSTNKLFFNKYEAKVEIEASYLIEDTSGFVDSDLNPNRRTNSFIKWKSISTCFTYILEKNKRLGYLDQDERARYYGFVKCVGKSAADFIKMYKYVSKNKDTCSIGYYNWKSNPGYVRREAVHFSIKPKMLAYFYTVTEAEKFIKNLQQNKKLPKSSRVVLHSISQQALDIISQDQTASVMNKLPFGKFEYKIWLGQNKLKGLSDVSKNNLLTVLTNYENEGLIRVQKSLREWLENKRRFIWNSTYIYADCEATKDLMSLVLVNTISKCEHIKVKNG